jgi:elongation factor Ts
MNIKILNELRNVTGLGIAQCSKLLKDNNGDLEKSILSAGTMVENKIRKLDDRVSGSGKVFSYIHTGFKKGGMVHIFSETDFVSNTEEFLKLGNDLAMHIVAMEPKTIDELIEQPFIKDNFITIKDLIKSLQVKVGEKIEIKNISVFC